MKDHADYEKDLATIRSMMERSSKFLSLSGLSGILAGIYAVAGAAVAYRLLHNPAAPFGYISYDVQDTHTVRYLTGLAALVLAASFATALWLSHRKAGKQGDRLWTDTNRRLLVNFFIPLVAGGLFILIILYAGYFDLVAPACLIFYGLALFTVSANMYGEVRYLGLCEIGLGLLATASPGFGLLFWSLGFGVLHIIYGAVMYKKYDK